MLHTSTTPSAVSDCPTQIISTVTAPLTANDSLIIVNNSRDFIASNCFHCCIRFATVFADTVSGRV